LSTARIDSGADVIDDCYNANPGSVRAAIDVMAACAGRRTLILGAMKELGPQSAQLHREIGAYAKAAGLEQFWGVGQELECAVEAFAEGGRYFSSRQAAVDCLPGSFARGDTVLIKGSRSAGMELILTALQGAGTEGRAN
jgi:UDP-N-acetylmuramoyl-tripeptide--D-alanyl-D-alanine ligase